MLLNESSTLRFGLSLGLVLLLGVPCGARAEPAAQAQQILQTTGVRGGLIVHLACGDGSLTAALGKTDAYRVHGLDASESNVDRARQHVRAEGLQDRVWVETWSANSLPYTDNLVNLLVADGLGGIPMEEVLRVLVPQGVAYVRQAGQWTKTIKPRPAEIDEWTHYLHGPDNNAVAHDRLVGPPRHLQWTAGPSWTRQHDHMSSAPAMVSAGGRLFAIIDEAPTASVLLPPRWSLVARDAFNGVPLWKRPISDWVPHLWPLKSGPAQLPRRLVAAGDRVFVTLGLDAPVTMLDAATGSTLRTFAQSQRTEELILSEGVLFLIARDGPNPLGRYQVLSTDCGKEKSRVAQEWSWDGKPRSLLALDAQDGSIRWKRSYSVAPLTLAADRQRVYFDDGEKLVALRRADGEVAWASAPISHAPAITVGRAPNLVAAGDVVLLSGGDQSMTAVAADTGKTLWTAPHPPSGYCSPEDLFVIHGGVWSGDIRNTAQSSGVFTERDLHDGRVLKEFPPDDHIYHFPHHRCYRSKATEQFILASRTGIEFIDTGSGHWTDHHWVRGGCLYGLMPCNGLVYVPPHSCACFARSKLNGYCALAPASPSRDVPKEIPDEGRLQRGPAWEERGQGTGDRGQGIGDREQGIGDRGQEIGDRGQGTGNRGRRKSNRDSILPIPNPQSPIPNPRSL